MVICLILVALGKIQYTLPNLLYYKPPFRDGNRGGSSQGGSGQAKGEQASNPEPSLQVLSACASPWTVLSSGCYLFNNTSRTWHEAYQLCAEWFSKVVELESQGENDALVKEINSQKVQPWIGLADLATEGAFRWTSTGKGPTYSNWHGGQPDNNHGNSQEDCAHYWTNNHWNDDECENRHETICEKI